MNKALIYTILFLALSTFCVSSKATLISGGVTTGNGLFVELNIPFSSSTPSNTVGNNNFNNANLYAFNEDQNIILPSSLNVDILASSGIAGLIAANTVVASHYVFFDPLNIRNQSGFVDFDADILAIITSTGTLAGSDFLLNNGVNYENPTFRGLESGDVVSVDSANSKRLLVSWSAGDPGDYVRVLTKQSPAGGTPTTPQQQIPEPNVLFLLLLGVFFLVKKQRARQQYY